MIVPIGLPTLSVRAVATPIGRLSAVPLPSKSMVAAVTVSVSPSASLSGVPPVRTLPVAVVSSLKILVSSLATGASGCAATFTVTVAVLVSPSASVMV